MFSATDPPAYFEEYGNQLTSREIRRFAISCCLRLREQLPGAIVSLLRSPHLAVGELLPQFRKLNLLAATTGVSYVGSVSSGGSNFLLKATKELLAGCKSSQVRHAVVCALYDPSLFATVDGALVSKLDKTFVAGRDAFREPWAYAQLTSILVALASVSSAAGSQDCLEVEGRLWDEYNSQLELLKGSMRRSPFYTLVQRKRVRGAAVEKRTMNSKKRRGLKRVTRSMGRMHRSKGLVRED